MEKETKKKPFVVFFGEDHQMDRQPLIDSFEEIRAMGFTDFVFECPRDLNESFVEFLKSGQPPEKCDCDIFRAKKEYPDEVLKKIRERNLPYIKMLYHAYHAGLNVRFMDVDSDTMEVMSKVGRKLERVYRNTKKRNKNWTFKDGKYKNYKNLREWKKRMQRDYLLLANKIATWMIPRNLSMGHYVKDVAQAAKGNVLVLVGFFHIEGFPPENKAYQPYLQEVVRDLGVQNYSVPNITGENKEFILSRVREACQRKDDQDPPVKNEQELRRFASENFFATAGECSRALRVWEMRK